MSALVASGMVPAYRSTGDVMRDAIYHRLKQIAVMTDNGELDTAVNMAMLMSDEMKIVSEAEQAEALIDAMRSNAQDIFARGGPGATARLRRFLAERREIVDSIPMPYRTDYVSAIEDFEKRIAPKKSRRKPKSDR
jgi:hypothetical protein